MIHLGRLLTLYQMARDCYHYKLAFSSKLLEKTVKRILWLSSSIAQGWKSQKQISPTMLLAHVCASYHMGYCSCFNSESCCSAAMRTSWSDLNGFLRRNPRSYLCCNSSNDFFLCDTHERTSSLTSVRDTGAKGRCWKWAGQGGWEMECREDWNNLGVNLPFFVFPIEVLS